MKLRIKTDSKQFELKDEEEEEEETVAETTVISNSGLTRDEESQDMVNNYSLLHLNHEN